MWKSQVCPRFKLIGDEFFMISISKLMVPLNIPWFSTVCGWVSTSLWDTWNIYGGAIPSPSIEKAQFFVGKRRDEKVFRRVTNSLVLNHCNIIYVLIDGFWNFEKENTIILSFISVSTPVSEQLARRRVEPNSNTINKLPDKIEKQLMKKGPALHMF